MKHQSTNDNRKLFKKGLLNFKPLQFSNRGIKTGYNLLQIRSESIDYM